MGDIFGSLCDIGLTIFSHLFTIVGGALVFIGVIVGIFYFGFKLLKFWISMCIGVGIILVFIFGLLFIANLLLFGHILGPKPVHNIWYYTFTHPLEFMDSKKFEHSLDSVREVGRLEEIERKKLIIDSIHLDSIKSLKATEVNSGIKEVK